MVTKESLQEKAKVLKIKAHPWVYMHVLILKDFTEKILQKGALRHAEEEQIPNFVVSFLNGDYQHVSLDMDFIGRAKHFTTSNPNDPKFTDFAYIMKMKKENALWLGASDGWTAQFLHYDWLNGIMEHVKEPFPIPPLWNVLKDRNLDLDLFPDVDGHQFIMVFDGGNPIAVIWWEINPPSQWSFSPRDFSKIEYFFNVVMEYESSERLERQVLGGIILHRPVSKPKVSALIPGESGDGGKVISGKEVTFFTSEKEGFKTPIFVRGDLSLLPLLRYTVIQVTESRGTKWYAFKNGEYMHNSDSVRSLFIFPGLIE